MATLADVARHAGVAASTVSYVLSGKRPVSAATRRRVERSIEVLGYHPHAGARALASSRSSIIALVVPLRSDLYLPVMMEIAVAVTTTARRFGYDVLLLTSDEGAEGIRRVSARPRPYTSGAAGSLSGLCAGSDVILLPPRLTVRASPHPREPGTAPGDSAPSRVKPAGHAPGTMRAQTTLAARSSGAVPRGWRAG